MSLLFVDGFDHYLSTQIGMKWDAATLGSAGAALGVAPIGRYNRANAGWSAVLGGNANTLRKDLPPRGTLIVGCHLYCTAAPLTNGNYWMQLLGTDGPLLSFGIGADGALLVFRKSAISQGSDILVASSGIGAIAFDQFYHVELRASISAAAAGAVEVRVNSVPVIQVRDVKTNATGSGSEQITSVMLRNAAGTQTGGLTYFDNLYICDTNGAANYDFLGEVQVSATVPAADGTYRDFTPSTGTAHYIQAGWNPPSTSHYVSASTVGSRDSYPFLDTIGVLGEVCGVQLVDFTVKDDPGQRTVAHFAKSGISQEVSGAIPLTNASRFHTTIHENDPATGTVWTWDGIHAAEFGIVIAG